jgi:tight adherence protein C
MRDSVYLIVATLGAFLSVMSFAALWVAMGRNHRPIEVLQAQLQSAGVEVRRARTDGPFRERILAPVAGAISDLVRRVTPVGWLEKTERKLILAGSPPTWTAERLILTKFMAAAGGVSLGYLLGARDDPHMLGVFWMPILGLIGYLVPGVMLTSAVTTRQESIRRSLPDTIDLLTISVEAGLAFDAALLHVRRTMKGPFSEEIGRMLHEIQLGVSRSDAFRHLSARTEVEELRGFILSMIQADVFGVSIASVLRAQSHELRTKRRQHAEERAMKIPVKLLFPMICCILPALLVVIMGPGAIKIADTLFGDSGLLTR